MDAFIRSSAQQQAATMQRLAAMERLLSHLNLPAGGSAADFPADAVQPRQLHSASVPAGSASPFGAAVAQRLGVALPAAANGGAAFSDDDSSAPSAVSSLDDDPLSPGSRAHVESMYQEALTADDGVLLTEPMIVLLFLWRNWTSACHVIDQHSQDACPMVLVPTVRVTVGPSRRIPVSDAGATVRR